MLVALCFYSEKDANGRGQQKIRDIRIFYSSLKSIMLKVLSLLML
jgi:hypothetical protein